MVSNTKKNGNRVKQYRDLAFARQRGGFRRSDGVWRRYLEGDPRCRNQKSAGLKNRAVPKKKRLTSNRSFVMFVPMSRKANESKATMPLPTIEDSRIPTIHSDLTVPHWDAASQARKRLHTVHISDLNLSATPPALPSRRWNRLQKARETDGVREIKERFQLGFLT